MIIKNNNTVKHSLKEDADLIIKNAISEVKPDAAVYKYIEEFNDEILAEKSGKIYMVSVGKAAYQMAKAAMEKLKVPLARGIVITKYGHVMGELGDSVNKIVCYEAGHPLPDANTYKATEEVLKMTENLNEKDTVLFLLSGGGSALFEKTLIDPKELENITEQLLSCSADITEINTIRKRLSKVKGGKFAKWCYPARVKALILSDIIGDPLDMIASGPTAIDSSTAESAIDIVAKYNLKLSDTAMNLLKAKPVKDINNTENTVIGSVRHLCQAAKNICEDLGYETEILTTSMCIEAKDAGKMLAEKIIEKSKVFEGSSGEGLENQGKYLENSSTSPEKFKGYALIAGGETVVHLTGKGKGGRNQELALSAARYIKGQKNICVFSVGSDGTDGPTDAAGGYVDGMTEYLLNQQDIDIDEILEKNDSYFALEKVNGLIKTGPTGTNVNDLSVALFVRGQILDV